jgi:hypothetical protein
MLAAWAADMAGAENPPSDPRLLPAVVVVVVVLLVVVEEFAWGFVAVLVVVAEVHMRLNAAANSVWCSAAVARSFSMPSILAVN